MDSAPAQEVTELLKQWEEQHATPAYDPIPALTRLAEIIESETENFMKKDPDPFDERHPSRTDPECALGHALKVMFKKDNFMTKCELASDPCGFLRRFLSIRIYTYCGQEQYTDIDTAVDQNAYQVFASHPPNYKTQSNIFKIPPRNVIPINTQPMSGVSQYNTKQLPPSGHDWTRHETECPKFDSWFLCEEKLQHPIEYEKDCVQHLVTEQRLTKDCHFTSFTLIKEAMEQLDEKHYKLVNDYIRDTYYSRLNISGRDVFKLNVAACRLTLDLMPGLEMSVVFQDNEALIHRLVGWARSAPEPLQSYATGLLAAAMEVQEIAANFRELNASLVPLMLRRLHALRSKSQEEKPSPSSGATRHFARFDKKNSSITSPDGIAKCNGPSIIDRESAKNGGGDVSMVAAGEGEEARDGEVTPVKNYSYNAVSPPEQWGMMSPPPRPPPPAPNPAIGPLPHENSSNSSWAEMETYVIGNIQIHPPTDATRQMLILRYLTPMGEYQEFLSHVFEQNALGLILELLNVRESKDSRLAFEALKYLASLLCHKKFSIDFINMGGLQKFLEVPRPSVAATGVSICLYYLAYCEDAMERSATVIQAESPLTFKAQVRLHLERCSHLCTGAPPYRFLTLDYIQHRACRIDGDSAVSDQLDSLVLRRDVTCACTLHLASSYKPSVANTMRRAIQPHSVRWTSLPSIYPSGPS
ncbi:Protein mahjong [Eumeta japonica]|uniref:Protein mahjong n=1 Tax=Eumeta variegata TaxID=151549 RepID=A0A4C1VHQ8_EUMVA|nr:Protein mahjong [Eumeta japonica]